MQHLKAFALKYLPNALLRPLKRFHYTRVVAAATLADEPEFEVIGRLVGPGDLVVDVGAHVGIYTKILSQLVGDTGQVIAFEPLPSTYAILANNVARLRLKNVHTFNLAISDRCGTASMEVARYTQNADGSYFAKIVTDTNASGLKTVQVNTTTLDLALSDVSCPARFVKIDVEGHELQCIRGAERVVSQFHPALFVEVLSDPDSQGSPAHTLFEILRARQYKAYSFEDGILQSRPQGDRNVNYFFLRDEHLERLKGLFGS